MQGQLNLLRTFLTDDQVLDLLCVFEKRKLEASREFRAMISDKTNITTLQAYEILHNALKEYYTDGNARTGRALI